MLRGPLVARTAGALHLGAGGAGRPGCAGTAQLPDPDTVHRAGCRQPMRSSLPRPHRRSCPMLFRHQRAATAGTARASVACSSRQTRTKKTRRTWCSIRGLRPKKRRKQLPGRTLSSPVPGSGMGKLPHRSRSRQCSPRAAASNLHHPGRRVEEVPQRPEKVKPGTNRAREPELVPASCSLPLSAWTGAAPSTRTSPPPSATCT